MDQSREIVWRHLAEKPAFLALIRAIEHRLLAECQPLQAPVLDVGAGDGHFASVAAGRIVDIGIDADRACLRKAKTRRAYTRLALADAAALPFAADSFATAICNCVLEHVPDLHSALTEMFRTLRPFGLLVLTVPTDRLQENLLIPRLLRVVGLRRLATRYADWFRRIQVHHHLYTPQEWVDAVAAAGFQVVRTRGYLSARATRWFELYHYAGWHNLLARALTGRWVIFPWRPLFVFAERRLARFVDEPPHASDSCLFLLARKPPSGY